MAQSVRDDSLIAFFTDSLSQEADLIYRFVFALSLNRKDASQLVAMTYKSVLSDLANLMAQGTTQIRIRLLKQAWAAVKALGNSTPNETSGFSKFLTPLAKEVRAALLLVDYAGLSAVEGADVLGCSPELMRQYMATGRKALTQWA